MAVNRQRWGWRTWSWVASLTILAGLAGVGSELMAGATVTHFNFHGGRVYAEWDNIQTGTVHSNAWVDATAGTTGPGVPTPTNFASTFVDTWDTATNTEIFGWGSGPFTGASDVLNVDPNLASGNTFVTIPATLNYADWNAGTVTPLSVTEFFNASEQSSGSFFDSKSITRQVDKTAAVDIRTQTDQREAINPTGSGGVTLVDAAGKTYPVIAPNTALSFGFYANVKNGNRTVSSH
jgi:hypothetical protein